MIEGAGVEREGCPSAPKHNQCEDERHHLQGEGEDGVGVGEDEVCNRTKTQPKRGGGGGMGSRQKSADANPQNIGKHGGANRAGLCVVGLTSGPMSLASQWLP